MIEIQHDAAIADYRRHLRVDCGSHDKTIDQHAVMVGKFLDETGEAVPDQVYAHLFKEWMIDQNFSVSHINNTQNAVEYSSQNAVEYSSQNAVEYSFEFLGHEDDLGTFASLPRKKTKPDPFIDDQVRSLLDATKTYLETAVIRTLVSSGIRCSEAANLGVDGRHTLLFDISGLRWCRRTRGRVREHRGAVRRRYCTRAVAENLRRRDAIAEFHARR